MSIENTRFSFFAHSFKKTTLALYKSTKIAHDMRLGYSILSGSVKHLMDVPSWQSATHLSYIVPGISLICSLVNRNITLDKRALLWVVVNGLQCYVLLLSDSKILTLCAYGLDMYFGFLNDRTFSKEYKTDELSVTRYLKNSSDTVYSLMVLGNIAANVFERTDIGLIFFEVSLFFKALLLTRDRPVSSNSLFYTLILTVAPLALLFSVDSDYNLIFGLVALTMALYSMSSTPVQCENSTQTETLPMV